MKTSYLLPHKYKKIGWFVFIPTAIIALITFFTNYKPDFLELKFPIFYYQNLLGYNKFFTTIENNIFDEILSVLLIVSGIVVAFSKEKNEDEFIAKIRLESLVWAVYLNYAILLFTVLFFFSLTFLYVLMFNMFTILLFFIIRFHWKLAKLKKTLR